MNYEKVGTPINEETAGIANNDIEQNAKMQRTREIDAIEASKHFERLDKTTDLRNEASSCFSNEMIPPYRPNPNTTYYAVSDEIGEDLLLIRTSLKKGVFNFPYMEISFCRISQNSPTINYEWLKTAIEEKILPESIKKDANYIQAIPVTHELEVYRQLQKNMQKSISDSDLNSIHQVEIIPDTGRPSSYRVKLRIYKCE